MPSRRASPKKTKTDPPRNDALDRWDDEGGSTARPVSEFLVTTIETLRPLERQVLHCLGAAVVIGWNELPTDVQRTLFKLASAEGGADAASELPTRIARFLHNHKDDEGTR